METPNAPALSGAYSPLDSSIEGHLLLSLAHSVLRNAQQNSEVLNSLGIVLDTRKRVTLADPPEPNLPTSVQYISLVYANDFLTEAPGA